MNEREGAGIDSANIERRAGSGRRTPGLDRGGTAQRRAPGLADGRAFICDLHLDQFRSLFLQKIDRRAGTRAAGRHAPVASGGTSAMSPKIAIPIDRQRGMTDLHGPSKTAGRLESKYRRHGRSPARTSHQKPGFQNRLTRSCRSGNRCSWFQEREPESESSCESGRLRLIGQCLLDRCWNRICGRPIDVARMSWSRFTR